MNFSQIKLVTFDIFGTVADWRQYVEMTFPGHYLDFMSYCTMAQKPNLAFQTFSDILTQAALNFGASKQNAALFASNFGKSQVFNDALALQEIKRLVPIGCISHSDPDHQISIMQQLGFVWDLIELSYHWQAYKPTSKAWDAVVARVCDQRAISPREWLHVAAYTDLDLLPAKERGLQTCFIPRPHASPATEAEVLGVDLMVSDLWQLHEGLRMVLGKPLRYVVTVKFDHPKIGRNVVRWMRQEHAADVMSHGQCLECRVFSGSDTELTCEYLFRTKAGFDRYVEELAPELRAKAAATFPSSIARFERSEQSVEFEVHKAAELC